MKDKQLSLASTGGNNTAWVSTIVISGSVIALGSCVIGLAWMEISTSMPILLRVIGV